jgi:hypothetical protein
VEHALSIVRAVAIGVVMLVGIGLIISALSIALELIR